MKPKNKLPKRNYRKPTSKLLMIIDCSPKGKEKYIRLVSYDGLAIHIDKELAPIVIKSLNWLLSGKAGV